MIEREESKFFCFVLDGFMSRYDENKLYKIY